MPGRPDDIARLQEQLNLRAGALGVSRLRTDGVLDAGTRRALGLYATRIMGQAAPGAGGPDATLTTALADTSPATLMREQARGRAAMQQLSGADWVRRQGDALADSKDVADLSPAFATAASRFLAALERAGATVRIEATRRSALGSWVAQQAQAVARGDLDPAQVPARDGAPLWDHGDPARSRAAAAEVATALGEGEPLPEGSPHFDGHAISMAAHWPAAIQLADAHGATHVLDQPRDGAANTDLHAIARSYRLTKDGGSPTDWTFSDR